MIEAVGEGSLLGKYGTRVQGNAANGVGKRSTMMVWRKEEKTQAHGLRG